MDNGKMVSAKSDEAYTMPSGYKDVVNEMNRMQEKCYGKNDMNSPANFREPMHGAKSAPQSKIK